MIDKLKHTPGPWVVCNYIPINLDKKFHYIGIVKVRGFHDEDVLFKSDKMNSEQRERQLMKQ